MKSILTGALLLLTGITVDASEIGTKLHTDLSDKDNERVVFNLRSHKYHLPACSAAKQCTNCVEISRQEAKNRGGVPCKLCNPGQ